MQSAAVLSKQQIVEYLNVRFYGMKLYNVHISDKYSCRSDSGGTICCMIRTSWEHLTFKGLFTWFINYRLNLYMMSYRDKKESNNRDRQLTKFAIPHNTTLHHVSL